MFRLARNEAASNACELAFDANILTNGASESSGRNLQQSQMSAASSSHNFAHNFSHDSEDPPTYSEAIAAP